MPAVKIVIVNPEIVHTLVVLLVTDTVRPLLAVGVIVGAEAPNEISEIVANVIVWSV